MEAPSMGAQCTVTVHMRTKTALGWEINCVEAAVWSWQDGVYGYRFMGEWASFPG